MKTVIYLLLVSLITVSAKHYCYYDADCSDLGDLVCMKSMCEAGICGCPRGLVARFIGSQNKFACVQIRTIGEECSTDHTNGICGAQNSFCDNNVCKCLPGTTFESRWGGEACLPTKEELVSSESCSTGLGVPEGTINCEVGQGWGAPYSGDPIASLMSHPLDGVPNVASCAQNSQTNLGNDFDDSPYMGGFRPECEPLRIGDVCLSDKDCEHIQFPNPGAAGWQIGGAKCVQEPSSSRRTCQCTNGTHVSDITGHFCARGLTFGQRCTAAPNTAIYNEVCDGTLGFRCGDPCDQDMIDDVNQRDMACVCDPGWQSSGTYCLKVEAGASCYGDYNCKSLGVNAACIDGECQQSAHPWSGAGQLTSATTLVWSVGLALVAWMRML